jgi:hypothetical protein
LSTHWYLFSERILEPILTAQSPPSLDELCRKHQVEDSVKASNMIITVKRRFAAVLQKHIRNIVASDEQVREEFDEIRRYFPNIAQDEQ